MELDKDLQARQEARVLAKRAEAAQQVANAAVAGGVQGIWNFAPVDLKVPDSVVVESIHLTDSLLSLTYRMNEPALHLDAWMNGQEETK